MITMCCKTLLQLSLRRSLSSTYNYYPHFQRRTLGLREGGWFSPARGMMTPIRSHYKPPGLSSKTRGFLGGKHSSHCLLPEKPGQPAVPALNSPLCPKPQKHSVNDCQGPSAWATYLESFTESTKLKSMAKRSVTIPCSQSISVLGFTK